MSDYAATRRYCNAALAIWQTIGNRSGEAWMLHGLGRAAYETGDYPTAENNYNQSLGIYREIGDSTGVADMLNVLGVIAGMVYGDFDRARARYDESLELRREVGDSFGIYQSLSNLGETAVKTGDYSRARSLIEESLAIGQKHKLTHAVAMEQRHLGMLALRQGDNERALKLLAESTRQFHQDGGMAFVVKNLMLLTELAAPRRQFARAARIGGAIEVNAAQINLRVATHEQGVFERVLADARSQVDAEAWIIAWARGRAMSIDEAIDYAVSD